MTELVTLDGFSLKPQGKTLSLGIPAGRFITVFGPSRSGKSRFLRALLGSEKPAQGRVSVGCSTSVSSGESFSRRSTPESIARSFSGRKTDVAAAALHAARVWDVKDEPLSSLPPGSRAACELLPCLCSEAPLALIDGQMERLDPWTRASVLIALRKRVARGSSAIVATNLPELAHLADLVLIFRSGVATFAGSTDELLRSQLAAGLHVVSKNQPGVRALIEPFKISVSQSPEGLTLKAQEGQQIAAKLLLEGYGDVEYVVLKEPTVEEALLALDGS